MNRWSGSNNGRLPTADKAPSIACAILDKVMDGWLDAKAVSLVFSEDELHLSLGHFFSFTMGIKLATASSLNSWRQKWVPHESPNNALAGAIRTHTPRSTTHMFGVSPTPNVVVTTQKHTSRWSSEIVSASLSSKSGIWTSSRVGKCPQSVQRTDPFPCSEDRHPYHQMCLYSKPEAY